MVGCYKVNNEVHSGVFTDCLLNELDHSLVEVRLDCEVFDMANVEEPNFSEIPDSCKSQNS